MGARPSSFKAPEVVAKPTRQWSPQQEDIFRWFEKRGMSGKVYPGDTLMEHLVVRARAGTGKTTTIIEGVNRAPESDILVCAFNKKIAEDLNSRLDNPAAEAKTLHALGFQAIKRQWRGIPLAKDSTRAESLTDKACGYKIPRQLSRLVTLLHTKGREMCPLQPTARELRDMALFFDLAPDDDWAGTPRSDSGFYDLDWVVGRALAAMEYAAKNEPTYDIGIDFADMIYLPLVWDLLSPDYEMVVVDEAQDLTLAQLEIAQRVCRGRICVVGDDRQAIYAFRGADTQSLDRLKQELGAAELPLTTTYRCAQSIVRKAQILVPDIQAGPTNPEGTVDLLVPYQTMLNSAEPGEFILSRLNAPLVSITLQLLKVQKRARMSGRDIGAGIVAILKKLRVRDETTIEDILSKIQEWETKTVTRFAAYGQNQLIERTRDQAGMLVALCEDAQDGADLINRITWLFEDVEGEDNFIVCSSVHKAKGLEADRVWILQETLYRRGITPEEQNIEYVATTRAKTRLSLVVGVPGMGSK